MVSSAVRIGDRFGRLLVVDAPASNGKRRSVATLCDCGVRKSVRVEHLTRGRSRSCGCLQKELASEKHTKHGASSGGTTSAEYRCWRSVRDRCSRSACPGFRNYGGRGITVCERWRESFANFLADVGPRPSPKHSLDRIDNAKGYEPGNVRWATPQQQARNTRMNRMLTFRGETRCVVEWAEQLGIPRALLGQRLHRGWTAERALAEPVHEKPARLTWAKVREIRRLASVERIPQRALDRMFGASQRAVGRVIRGEVWREREVLA